MQAYTRIKGLGRCRVLADYGPHNEYYVIDEFLPKFARLLKRNMKEDHQNVVACDGPTGGGKSTVMINLALAMDKHWTLRENYIYDRPDLERIMDEGRTDRILIMDEGSVILSAFNSLRKEDKEIVQLFDTMRVLHNTVLVCCPNIYKLNRTFREDHVQYRLHCPRRSPVPGYKARGFVKCYEHESSEWGEDGYYTPIATGVFDKLPRGMQKEYDQVKMEHLNGFIHDFAHGGAK